jgi:hypothetical protein
MVSFMRMAMDITGFLSEQKWYYYSYTDRCLFRELLAASSLEHGTV